VVGGWCRVPPGQWWVVWVWWLMDAQGRGFRLWLHAPPSPPPAARRTAQPGGGSGRWAVLAAAFCVARCPGPFAFGFKCQMHVLSLKSEKTRGPPATPPSRPPLGSGMPGRRGSSPRKHACAPSEPLDVSHATDWPGGCSYLPFLPPFARLLLSEGVFRFAACV
jgi:hypothetical protein